MLTVVQNDIQIFLKLDGQPIRYVKVTGRTPIEYANEISEKCWLIGLQINEETNKTGRVIICS